MKMVDFEKSTHAAPGSLDTAAEWCYAEKVKSVEREKYRPRSAQRARHLLRAGTGTGRERTPGSCNLNLPLAGQ